MTLVKLVFFFLIYCFVGWIIESTYVSVRTRKLTNRGFMRGPVIPIYGFGGMMLVLSSTAFMKWPVAVFFAGMIGCSVLEYFTGMAMEAIFKVRYWDYSDRKFNLNGHICLLNSFYWGICSLGVNYGLHKYVVAPIPELLEKYVSEYAIIWITIGLSAIFLVDFTLAFKAAMDLRDLIIKMEKARDEMRLMAKRLDVMVAYANESIEERKDRMESAIDNWSEGIEEKMDKMSDNFDAKIDALTDNIEEKFISIKKAIEEKPQNFAEGMKAEFYELRGKFKNVKEKHSFQNFIKDFYLRGTIQGNPTIVSYKFKDSLESIKEAINSKKNK